MRPFVYARQLLDPATQRYEEITDRAYPLELFARGYSYEFLWLFPTDLHLFGTRTEAGVEAPRVYLLGADKFGRDRLSRLLMATRYSLFIGPLGALLASALGILIGAVAGYVGGWTDAMLMRAADVIKALPTLVLILAVRATFPPGLPPADAIKLLLILFLMLGWAEMARLARGLTMELRQREYVMAAVSLGCSPARVIVRHILPGAAMSLAAQSLILLPDFLLARPRSRSSARPTGSRDQLGQTADRRGQQDLQARPRPGGVFSGAGSTCSSFSARGCSVMD